MLRTMLCAFAATKDVKSNMYVPQFCSQCRMGFASNGVNDAGNLYLPRKNWDVQPQ